MLTTEFKHPWVEAVRDPDPFWPLWPGSEGPKWELQEDHQFTLAFCPSRIYKIPKGYVYDKASVPPIFWGFPFYYMPDGTCSLAALEHDFLCDILTGGSPWLQEQLGGVLPDPPEAWEVHLHFRTRLYQCHTRFSKAETMGNAVAAFGPKGWFWDIFKKVEELRPTLNSAKVGEVLHVIAAAEPLLAGTQLGAAIAVIEGVEGLRHSQASASDIAAVSETPTA